MARHQRRGTRILGVAAALALAAGSLAGGQAVRAATGDPVLLNEALLSHSGADTAEFVELYGTPGASLAGLSLLAVEGDSAQVPGPGTVSFRVDFAPGAHLGGNGFFLVGNPAGLGTTYGVTPNVAIVGETFQNGSQTLALVETASAPALGGAVSGGEVVRDAVGINDNGTADRFFFGAPVVGPDPAGFMPPGVRRATDGVDTDSALDWLITTNSLDASHTPTAASPYNVPPSADCGSPLTTVSGTQVSRPVSATDPDGMMTGFTLAVEPAAASVTLSGVVPAAAVGGTATAAVDVGAATPAGTYDVTVTASNTDASPQLATCHLAVTVTPPLDPTPEPPADPTPPPAAASSMDALHLMLDGYLASGDVASSKAHLLTDRLARAERFWGAGQEAAALAQLHAFTNQVMGLSPRWVTPAAAEGLTEMADALAAALPAG